MTDWVEAPAFLQAVALAMQGRDRMSEHRDRDAIEFYDRALTFAQAAYSESEPAEDLTRFVIYIHNVLGVLLPGQSNLDLAGHHFTEALRLSRELDPGGRDVAKF